MFLYVFKLKNKVVLKRHIKWARFVEHLRGVDT